MQIDGFTRRILLYVHSLSDFSIDEIYMNVTNFKTIISGEQNEVLCPNVQVASEEINKIASILRDKFLPCSLFDSYPNIKEKKKIIIRNDENKNDIYTSVMSTLSGYSDSRYFKTSEYDFFISHNYTTKNEYDLACNKRIQKIKDWLPIVISVAALIVSLVATLMNFVPQKPTKIEIISIPKNIEDSTNLQSLTNKLNDINKRITSIENQIQNNKE